MATETTTDSVTTEITEDTKKKLVATGQLFHALAADPRYRKRVLGLIKEAAPDSVIPELDTDRELEERTTARVKPLEEKNAALETRLKDLETQRARDLWKTEEGLTDEEVVEIEELAVKSKIGDAKTAVSFWRQGQALGTPRGTARRDGADEYLGELGKINPNNGVGLKAAALRQASKIISELRRGRRAG